MGARDKFYSLLTAAHGVDTLGINQATGTISSVAKYGAGKWAKYALVTEGAAHNLTKGQQVNIGGTTDYDGPSIVIATVGTTKYVIKKAFTVTKTGTRDGLAGEGNWDAMMPVGGDLAAANVSLQFWQPEMEGGDDTDPVFSQDKVYVFPGGIKNITIATAGNVKLYRAASIRRGGVRNPATAAIYGYNPTGGTAGDTIDILGKNFDPALSNNIVKFYDGTTAALAYPSAINSDGNIITVVVPSGAGATGVVTVKTNGLATATGPAFNGH